VFTGCADSADSPDFFFYVPKCGIEVAVHSSYKADMVILKSHKAFGSFLGRGTHVWLEVHPADGKKVTFSGAKIERLLGVVENLKKDYHKQPTRGSVVIPAPAGIGYLEWANRVIESGREVKDSMHKELGFSGLFPWLPGRGNCCSVAQLIITRAGGEIPEFRPSGVAPGLRTPCFSTVACS
jgi:hypothetical protein